MPHLFNTHCCQTLIITNLFIICTVWTFLECHINENMQHEVFQTVFCNLAMYIKILSCLCMTWFIHCFLAVNNIFWTDELQLVYWFTYCSISRFNFWWLWIKVLHIFTSRYLCGPGFSNDLCKYIEVCFIRPKSRSNITYCLDIW